MSVQDIDKTLSSVCKGEDKKRDVIMLLSSEFNWDTFFTSVPCALALFGDLILISADMDFSLETKPPRDGFKLLRYPNSFRASLVQVSNAGWSAFNDIHSKMDQICVHSRNFDEDAVRFLMEGTPDEVQRVLPISLTEVLNIATGIEDKFIEVMELTVELLEACTNTNGVYDEKTKETEIAILVAKTEKERRTKEVAESQRRLKKIETEFAKWTLKDAKRRQELAYDELKKSNEQLTKVLMDNAKLDLKQIDFDTIRETLIKGIAALEEVREQWGKLVCFFQMLSNVIKCCPYTCLTDSVDQVKQGREIKMEDHSIPLPNIFRDVTSEQALKASRVPFIVRTISETYVKISNAHLMDSITCLGRLVTLDPKKDGNEITIKRQELHDGCAEAQRAIKGIMNLESIIVYLSSGLHKFAVFVQNLQTSCHQRLDDISYIETELLPSVEKAKQEFDEMKTCVDRILQEVNNDLEESLNEVQRQSEIIKQMDSDLASLKTQLTATESDVRDAEKQHEQKKKELSDAESALSTARRKLAEAESDQKAAVIGGAGTAAVCLLSSIVFPPALIGAVGGLAVEVAGITVFEIAKQECQDRVGTARREVSSSQHSVQRARVTMEVIQTKLLKLEGERRLAHEEMERNQARKLNLQIKQTRIIELNEGIKVFNQKLCHFHGTFRVLSHETRGGYSTTMLKLPTLALCDSLSSLLQCPALCESCSKSQMIDMTQKLQMISYEVMPCVIKTQRI